MKKNTKTGLIILGILVIISIITSILSINNTKISTPNVNHISYDSEVKSTSTRSNSRDYIAAVYIEGTITQSSQDYDQVWLKNTIIKLRDDKHNKAIAIFINSPGGAVYQTDEIYLLLQEYKKVTGRKVYVYQGQIAASGGYYISCAADQIYANRNTLTGSIGVIAGQSFDLTELMKKYGVKSETIHAGKNKNMGNYNEPLSDEQRQILQSIADECYVQFTEIVASARNLPIEEVQKLADGRVYTAKQALDNGLIDKIGLWDEMIKDLSIGVLNKSDINVVTYKKEKEKNLMSMLMNNISSIYRQNASAGTGLPSRILEDINSDVELPAYLYK